MSNELYIAKPVVVTAIAVTEGPNLGNMQVTDEFGNATYMSVEDFTAKYQDKPKVHELGYMKVVSPKGTGHYPGSTVKVFEAENALDMETKINDFFTQGMNALVIEQHFWGNGDYVYAAFTLNTVIDDERIKEDTEIQAEARRIHEERQKQRALTNKTAIEIATKLAEEHKAEIAAQRKQLEDDAALGKHCRKNHKKVGKK